MADQATRRVPRWVPYTALRLVFFAVPLVGVYALGGNITVAAIAAAIIGLCLSVIFLGRQRTEAAEVLEERARRRPRRIADEDVEDGALGPSTAEGVPPGDQNASAAASPKP